MASGGRGIVAAVLALLSLGAPPVAAEDATAPTRVRVTTRTQGRVVGDLLRHDTSGLTLGLDDATRTIALDDVTGFEVSRGRRSQKTKWALIGAIPWMVVVALTLADGGTDESGIVSPQSALLLGGGVAAGLVIGSHRKADVWERAAIPGATSRSGARELRFGVSLSF